MCSIWTCCVTHCVACKPPVCPCFRSFKHCGFKNLHHGMTSRPHSHCRFNFRTRIATHADDAVLETTGVPVTGGPPIYKGQFWFIYTALWSGFFKKIAIERVWFRRSCWHTSVQILGKCPPPGTTGYIPDPLTLFYRPSTDICAIEILVCGHRCSIGYSDVNIIT